VAETGEARRPGPARDRRRDTRLILLGVTAALLIWFALANLQDVGIHFWVVKAHAPLVVVIVIAGLFGALIGAMVQRRRRPARRD